MPRHPVHTLLAEAAYAGREATEEELAELQLDSADRELVRKAAREAAFQHAGGNRGGAHEHALRPLTRSSPGCRRSSATRATCTSRTCLDGLGPAELAARIPR